MKRFIIMHPRDSSGCSHYRLRFVANHLNANVETYQTEVIVSPIRIMDAEILQNTRAIICQRFLTEQDSQIIRDYKALQPKYGFKLIFEIDDICFSYNDEYIPDYNPSSIHLTPEVLKKFDKILAETLPLYDHIVVSTDYLKHCIETKFNVWNVRTIRNVVPSSLWSTEKKQHIETDIVKPHILYTGSPTHYRTPIPINADPTKPLGVVGLTGDFNEAIIDFIIDAVQNDKIQFTVMGALPFFFEPIAPKIQIYNWVDTNNFPSLVRSIKADFQIAPLCENNFNRCKSALRFYEACSVGHVLLGTDFPDSPYNCIYKDCKLNNNMTSTDIESLVFNMCKKDNYNAALDYQYNFLLHNHHVLEDDSYVKTYLSMT